MAKAVTGVTSIRLHEKQLAWLKAREDETGESPSDIIRRLIVDAMTGGAPSAHAASDREAQAARLREIAAEQERARKEAARAAKVAALREQLKALERGEDPDDIDAAETVYSDPETYTEAGEFDETMLGEDDQPGEPDPFEEAEAPRVATVSAHKAGAFSLTRPVGLRADLMGGSQMGQARENILRENFRWLPAAGGRRR